MDKIDLEVVKRRLKDDLAFGIVQLLPLVFEQCVRLCDPRSSSSN